MKKDSPEWRVAMGEKDFGSAEYLDAIGVTETPLEWFGRTLSPEDATAVYAFSEWLSRAGKPPTIEAEPK